MHKQKAIIDRRLIWKRDGEARLDEAAYKAYVETSLLGAAFHLVTVSVL